MAESVTYNSVATAISRGTLAPVYLLHGEEGYFIDKIVRMIERTVPAEDRDFNLFTIYAPESTPDTVMDACRQFPMMGDKIVVILKEVQNAKSLGYLKALPNYVKNPSSTTTLVIVHRGDKASAKELTDAIRKCGGVVFESKKLKDNALQAEIASFIKDRGLHVDPKALSMLTEFVGSDLSRIDNEVGKLTVTLGQGATITPESVERNIGFSKDFNTFELVSALARRDAEMSMRIVRYFAANPKANPVVRTLTPIFNLFQNTLIAMYSQDKSERTLMGLFGFKWPVQLRDIQMAMRNFNAWNVINIIGEIRRCDVESKGIGSRFDQFDLLQQLIFYILNPEGRKS